MPDLDALRQKNGRYAVGDQDTAFPSRLPRRMSSLTGCSSLVKVAGQQPGEMILLEEFCKLFPNLDSEGKAIPASTIATIFK